MTSVVAHLPVGPGTDLGSAGP